MNIFQFKSKEQQNIMARDEMLEKVKTKDMGFICVLEDDGEHTTIHVLTRNMSTMDIAMMVNTIMSEDPDVAKALMLLRLTDMGQKK